MMKPESATTPVTVRCWGTRGSIPSPGPATAGYGGNTSCLEVCVGDRRLIFDAGSGARALGVDLASREGPTDATIFLSHFHWDHIQGFPFFPPLYDPGATLRIVGPVQHTEDGTELGVESLFAGQMGPIYFPIPFQAVAADCTFGHLNEGSWERDGIVVKSMRVKHPSFTVGYRIEAGGVSIGYIPDNELLGDGYDAASEGDAAWRARLVDFLGDIDLLYHDAMYTEEEYLRRRLWGHSTYQQAVDLAHEAGAGDLVFFHHDPERSDEALDTIVSRVRDDAMAAGRSVNLRAAAEGHAIILEES